MLEPITLNLDPHESGSTNCVIRLGGVSVWSTRGARLETLSPEMLVMSVAMLALWSSFSVLADAIVCVQRLTWTCFFSLSRENIESKSLEELVIRRAVLSLRPIA